MSLSIPFTNNLPSTPQAKPAIQSAPAPASEPEPELEISLDKLILPISNGLPADVYHLILLCSHKHDMELREVLVESVRKYCKDKVGPKDKLPTKKQAKFDEKVRKEREKQRDKWI